MRPITVTQFKSRLDTRGEELTINSIDALAAHLEGRTVNTGETLSEYLDADGKTQLKIKDVGGFVAGSYANHTRGHGNLRYRSALSIDIDDAADYGAFSMVDLVYGCAAVAYTTHKDTAAAPRYRIIIPLSRDVTAEEYKRLSEAVCAGLLPEGVDPTTHQADRLMFYPSHPCDRHTQLFTAYGPYLDPDTVLPHTPAAAAAGAALNVAVKQADPRAKGGIVGAFCRVYDVERAMSELLPGRYDAAGEPGRYTYHGAQAPGGVTVLDNGLFFYSFHATDPLNNKLLNAFDLVRLAKFGKKDKGGEEGEQAPSYRAMKAFAEALPEVRERMKRERSAEVAELLAEAAPGAASGWVAGLETNKNGSIKGSIENYERILRHDPVLESAFKYNEFTHRLEVLKPLPWRQPGKFPEWSDADDSGLRGYIEKVYKTVSRGNLEDAFANVGEERRYHPIRQYLDAQSWDGTPRVESLLIDYLGAEDTPYVRAVTRKALCAAVARIYKPGCKFDYVLTLIGPEGIGKSSILARLGGEWFSDTFLSVTGKEGIEQLQGVWLLEIGELAGLKKAEVENIKAYISSREDRARMAYARKSRTFPRQCVFFATGNNETFLRSSNGNRRFWPVDVYKQPPVRRVWEDLTDAEVGQVWAEAVSLYRDGERLFLPPHLEQQARLQQEVHQEADEWEGIIRQYLDTPLPAGWDKMKPPARRLYIQNPDEAGGFPRVRVCPVEIWYEALGRDPHELDRQKSMRINTILSSLPGWERAGNPLRFGPYGLAKGFMRIGQEGTI